MLNEVKMICEDCGACEGDKSKIDKNIVLNVRVFLDRMLCSDCEDSLCYSLEN